MSTQIRKNLITIVLPLWDREIYTPTWIKENLVDDFDYIIADGSKTDANQNIFNTLSDRVNIRYIRYKFDENIADYVKKMLDAVSRVETPYVMTCDNDDFLHHKGIIQCVNALEHHQDYGFSHGVVRKVTGLAENPQNGVKYYRLLSDKVDISSLSGLMGIGAIKQLFRPYKYVWYGVYQSVICKKIWQQVADSQIDNIFLLEMLQNQLAFAYGKMFSVNSTHYIRLANPITNSANQFKPSEYPDHHRIYFDEDYRSQVYKMSEIVANIIGVNSNDIYGEYRYFYSGLGRSSRLRTQLKAVIVDYLRDKISPSLSIKLIKKII